MTAYYNEIDPFASAWLRELIKAGLIAPGDVDERSIHDVRPQDLAGYTQCHFFAGIGGWSYALRLAGWPDSRPVWTGSCPCPPFSTAGKKKACPSCGGTNPVPHVGRTGYFVCCLCDHEWFADARHLWPEQWRLIRDGRPPVFLGEQVASADGRTWFASVRASMEILGYADRGADLCAAGVGAPHIRQRLWFVGEHYSARPFARGESTAPVGYGNPVISAGGISVALGDTQQPGLERLSGHGDHRDEPGRDGAHSARSTAKAGATRGFWRNADWIACRDGKARPAEPTIFPLAHGIPNRVGILRGAGNAIVPELAAEVIRAYMER